MIIVLRTHPLKNLLLPNAVENIYHQGEVGGNAVCFLSFIHLENFIQIPH